MNDESQKDTMNQAEQSGEQKDTVATQLAACQKDLDAWKNKYLHLVADFDNAKKRMIKERQQYQEQAYVDVIETILPILDDVDRALDDRKQHAVSPEIAAWLDGFSMIQKALHKILERYGVTEIAIAPDFDPEIHEAVVSVISETHQPGQVVAILQKGYTINGRVIRPAKVSVAQ